MYNVYKIEDGIVMISEGYTGRSRNGYCDYDYYEGSSSEDED